MTKRSSFRYFKTSPKVILPAAMPYVQFPLSLRIVEDLTLRLPGGNDQPDYAR